MHDVRRLLSLRSRFDVGEALAFQQPEEQHQRLTAGVPGVIRMSDVLDGPGGFGALGV